MTFQADGNRVLWWVLGIVGPLLLTAMSALGLILFEGVRGEIHQIRLEHHSLEARLNDHADVAARAIGIIDQHERRISLLEDRRTGWLDFDPHLHFDTFARNP